MRFVLTIVLGLFVSVTASADTVDQSNLYSPTTRAIGTTSRVFFAQTFTAGLTGFLSRINLQIHQGGSPGIADVQILNTVGGVPNTVLFATTFDTSTIPTFSLGDPIPVTTIDISSAGIAVMPGTVLAIAVGGVNVLWEFRQDSPYGAGAAYESISGGPYSTIDSPADADLGFRTWVDEQDAVPEPFLFEIEFFPLPILGTVNSYSATAIGDGLRYFWDFDNDGEFEIAGQTVEHIFDEAGAQVFGLRIVDAAGRTTTTSFTAFSTVPEPATAILLLLACGAVALRRRR